MQVSKGLKRATGRGEQVQHHLGTLNFWGPARLNSLLANLFHLCHPDRSEAQRAQWRDLAFPVSAAN